MTRLAIPLLCALLVPNAAWALPRLNFSPPTPSLTKVDDDFPRTDCVHFGPEWSPPECSAYRHQLAVARALEQQASLSAINPNAVGDAASGMPGPAKKASRRPLGEPERNAMSAKPLKPVTPAPVMKPVAGKNLDDRLKHIVGQLLLTGFSGREPEDAGVASAARDMSAGRISGFILRDSNIENYLQVRQLITAISSYGSEMPALIAVDQPGGPDSVLSEDKGFTFYGSASSVSIGSTPQEAQFLYRAMAGELAALGISLNIGPSEDLCREGGVNLSAACYGTAPYQVTAYARAFNFGHHDRGVLTALRHEAFRAGLQTYPGKEPASLAMIHLLVRGQTSDAHIVRFKATEQLALTDVSFAGLPHKARWKSDLQSATIFELDPGPSGSPIRYQDVIIRAFQLGADMIMVRDPSGFPGDLPALSLEAVQAGLKSGRLRMSRIEEAYRHVQSLKQRLLPPSSRTRVAGLNR